MSALRIAQITDCHLKSDKTGDFYGCQPYQNLSIILAEIADNQHNLDAVLLTGDLIQDEVWQSYQNFIDLLDSHKWNIPFYLIPGNHDVPELFERFACHPVFKACKSAESIVQKKWQILLFNSYAHNRNGAGHISKSQLDTKISQISSDITNILVVLHHHLVPFNSFIDKYDLQDSDCFKDWLKQEDKIKAIVHGHVHSIASGYIFDKTWFACPASSVEFGHGDEFEVKEIRPRYQIVELSDDGQVQVSVKSLNL